MCKSNNTLSAGLLVGYPGRVFIATSEPTRIRDGQTSNCLDLVLTSIEDIVSEINILPGVGRSDCHKLARHANKDMVRCKFWIDLRCSV